MKQQQLPYNTELNIVSRLASRGVDNEDTGPSYPPRPAFLAYRPGQINTLHPTPACTHTVPQPASLDVLLGPNVWFPHRFRISQVLSGIRIYIQSRTDHSNLNSLNTYLFRTVL
ncbi:hypothetical protein ElyMa_001952000 [Elysia marginata]|uniref:Uncharacterized protein n=1 Tax=Elysia marginata TaxID=1093978 RepID=A0AAV4EXA7_9GAST|nr:hypothetical protein ElyMa_001952000 [Elysia marginata]